MPLKARLALLKDQKEDAYIASLRLRGKYLAQTAARIRKTREDFEIEMQKSLDEFTSPEARERCVRSSLKIDLQSVGFQEHIFVFGSTIYKYLAEPHRLAEVDMRLTQFLTANPAVDLYSYEEDLEFLILRIDKPEEPPKKKMGFGIYG